MVLLWFSTIATLGCHFNFLRVLQGISGFAGSATIQFKVDNRAPDSLGALCSPTSDPSETFWISQELT